LIFISFKKIFLFEKKFVILDLKKNLKTFYYRLQQGDRFSGT
jgi:hypothetical protein